jgi:hypothetical protein
MSGPTTIVLLREPLKAAQQTDLENLLTLLGTRDAAQGDISVSTTTPLGEVYENKHGWPFLVHIIDPTDEDTEFDLIQETWSFLPQQAIEINAMVN